MGVVGRVAVAAGVQLQAEEAELVPLPEHLLGGVFPRGVYVPEPYKPPRVLGNEG